MQRTARFSAIHLLVALLFSIMAAQALAQSHPEYIPLGGGVKAVLYRPDSNPSPHVGVIIIHRTANYLQHQGCTQLSQRGFMVLCMNSRFDNNEALVNWELIALDVKRGVDYLRNTQHMNKVIFFGHSGGGPTTTFYQAVAEAGPSYCQGANKLNALLAINPAVNNENRPDLLQNKLDPFNPKNGYNPNGDSHYPPDFQKAYTAAQAQRHNDWIDRALYIREQIKQGKWIYSDNDDITIGRGGGSQAGGGSGANLFVMDPTISCCSNQPAKLLKDNGTIVTQ